MVFRMVSLIKKISKKLFLLSLGTKSRVFCGLSRIVRGVCTSETLFKNEPVFAVSLSVCYCHVLLLLFWYRDFTLFVLGNVC